MLRSAVNRLGGMFGLRVVNRDWGPRGFAATFRAARQHGFAPATIIDIGASNGVWTRECQAVFPAASYVLIDPLPQNAPHLQALANERPNVRYWTGAIGPSLGELVLHQHGDQTSALPSEEFAGVPLSVAQKPLDLLADEFGLAAPLLIKADVQGFELEVLRGAERCLANCGLLMLELSVQPVYPGNVLAHEVIGYLGDRGFRVFDIASYAQRPKDRALAQMDVVFVPAKSNLVGAIGWN